MRDRIQLQFDTAEAAVALELAVAHGAGRISSPEDWRRLFVTDGYRRLKERESAMHRGFTDSSFAAFVVSDTLAQRVPALRRALDEWQGVDLEAAATRMLAYLPERARIAATVYVVVKPKTNSFVWGLPDDPAIFLYLDPAVPVPKLENTIAHELHHIGFGSARAQHDSILAALPDTVRAAAEWMGAFGEGFAMLAAAGGPSVHPHAVSPPAERARWDRDLANFNRDVHTLETFFLDVVTQRVTAPDSIQAIATAFYGTQGPWYTVGWKMAVLIEEHFGRPELIRCMTDPGRLVRRYNEAAAAYNETHTDTLARWAPALVTALAGK